MTKKLHLKCGGLYKVSDNMRFVNTVGIHTRSYLLKGDIFLLLSIVKYELYYDLKILYKNNLLMKRAYTDWGGWKNIEKVDI